MQKTAPCNVVQISSVVFSAYDSFNHEHLQTNKRAILFFSYTAENLWKAIHHGNKKDGEQFLWNHAMQNLGIQWNVTTSVSELCEVQTGWQSYGRLASIVFPQNVFCRKCCTAEHTSEYYLIHLNAIHGMIALKIQKLKEMGSWFLLDHWKDSVNSPLEGNSWLMSIYDT